MRCKAIAVIVLILCPIALILALRDGYHRYTADFCIRQAELVKDERIADLLIQHGLKHTADWRFKHKAGFIYAQMFEKSGDVKTYRKARKLLNEAQRANPFEPYILFNIIVVEINAHDKKIGGDMGYARKAADVLLKIDRYNPQAWAAARGAYGE